MSSPLEGTVEVPQYSAKGMLDQASTWVSANARALVVALVVLVCVLVLWMLLPCREGVTASGYPGDDVVVNPPRSLSEGYQARPVEGYEGTLTSRLASEGRTAVLHDLGCGAGYVPKAPEEPWEWLRKESGKPVEGMDLSKTLVGL